MSEVDEARAERERDIEVLRACECLFPLKVMMNASGHAGDCPAHALWRARQWRVPEPGLAQNR